MGEKITLWMSKRQTSEISHEKTWTWLTKGHLKRETEARLIVAQNNAIRTNYVKTKVGHNRIASIGHGVIKTKRLTIS